MRLKKLPPVSARDHHWLTDVKLKGFWALKAINKRIRAAQTPQTHDAMKDPGRQKGELLSQVHLCLSAVNQTTTCFKLQPRILLNHVTCKKRLKLAVLYSDQQVELIPGHARAFPRNQPCDGKSLSGFYVLHLTPAWKKHVTEAELQLCRKKKKNHCKPIFY